MFSGPSRRRESVTDQIKHLILTEGLRPGDLMPTEAEICARLEVSRSSVREAMRTLAALDIVEVRHGHGTYVGQLSLAPLVEGLVFRGVVDQDDSVAALREVVEVREALDLAMAEQIVAALDGTHDPELEQLVAAMTAKAARGEAFAAEDLAFHTRLLGYLDNALVGQLVAAFWEVNTIVYPMLGLAPAEDIVDTAHAHGAMLEAAASGDAARYREAVIEHYLPLRRALDKAATRR
ncbi:DNA-binding FadR family transcriptional regulator [Agromyces hippuratus]|uniref:DNA-binding FadR family transcriptional regulator n=1 Tax=Agromyces hippuratus TaxID=286438 RepID=A0A852X1Q9_9MICO|nr:GntR family transcriptional regulator [Agromyces hippuratus]NYG21364.1 DNA-binding FadR family transcriptional regulator [Agromyces hippuratus]